MVLAIGSKCEPFPRPEGPLNALAALLPDTAERVRGTETQTVPISELNVSDVVLVRPGIAFRRMAKSSRALPIRSLILCTHLNQWPHSCLK